DLVAVLLHVLGVGDLRPGRGVDVHVALGQGGVEGPGLAQRLHLDVAALLLQQVLEQVGRGQTIRPGGDEAQRNGATDLAPGLLAALVGTGVAGLVGAGVATGLLLGAVVTAGVVGVLATVVGAAGG